MRIVFGWLPAAAYMALIWALSSRSLSVDVSSFPFKDKGVHFLEYAVLGLLLAHAVRRTWPSLGGLRFYLVPSLLAAGFGLVDELHQAFVPSRFSSMSDLLADVLGALLGVALFLVLQNIGGKLRASRG